MLARILGHLVLKRKGYANNEIFGNLVTDTCESFILYAKVLNFLINRSFLFFYSKDVLKGQIFTSMNNLDFVLLHS